MRTLALLVAVLLLTLLAQGEPLRESAVEVPAQEDPEPQDQDVAISFAEDGISTRAASDSRKDSYCSCRIKRCRRSESGSGYCIINSVQHKLCCR